MNRKVRVITVILITALVLTALPLAAQQSGTKTASRFWSTDVDNFMSYHDYSSVNPDNWFGFVGLGLNWSAPKAGSNAPESPIYPREDPPSAFALFPKFDLGYAKTFGGLYVGAYYNGSLFATGERAERIINSSYTALAEKTGATDTTTIGLWGDEKDAKYTNNSLEALIGFGSMAVKVGFKEELYGYTPRTSTITDELDSNDNLTRETKIELDGIFGTMDPYLGWGMTLPLGNMVIKPKVELGLGIVTDRQNRKTTITPAALQTTVVGENGYNAAKLTPNASVGVEVGLPKSDGSELGFGLEYAIEVDLYSNKYDVGGFSGTKAGTVNWIQSASSPYYFGGSTTTVDGVTAKTVTDEATFTFNEKKYMGHTINPYVYYLTALGERASVGVSFGIEFGIGTSGDDQSTEYNQKRTTTSYGDDKTKNTVVTITTTNASGTDYNETSTSFSLKPTLSAGVTFKVIPDRFDFNTGFSADIFNFTGTTTKKAPKGFRDTWEVGTDDAGNESKWHTVSASDQEDSLTVENVWQVPVLTLGLGCTLHFSEISTFDVGLAQPLTKAIPDFILLYTIKK